MQPLWKTAWHLLKRFNTGLSHDPAILFLRVYPREMKICVHAKICTWIFTAAFLMVAQTQRPSRCLLMENWVNYTCTYLNNGMYLYVTRNEVFIHTTAWMNLASTVLCERRQTPPHTQKKKATNSMISFTQNIRDREICKTKTGLVAEVCVWGNWVRGGES